MILIKCDKNGISEIGNNDSYFYLLEKLEKITEELESNGIMLVDVEVSGVNSRTHVFASIENGWECVYIIASGYVGNVTGL